MITRRPAGPEPHEVDYRAVVEALQSFSTILMLSDGRNLITWVNTAATAFLGRPAQDIIGQGVFDLLVEPSRVTVTADFSVSGADDGAYGEHEFEFARPGASSVWGLVRTIRLKNRDGLTSQRMSVIEDITARHLGDAREALLQADLRQAEGFALFMARHDPLTGLLQRSALIEQLAEKASRGHGARALMLVDIDDFNAVNDCLGHAVGDAVILEIASRIRDAFPELLVARYGGDQFAVVAPFVVDRDLAEQAAETVQAVLEPDVEVSGQTIRVTASIGIALQELRETSSILVRNADAALARAKHSGPGQYRVYDDEMRRRSLGRLQIQDGLRAALSCGQFRLAYQPIVRLEDRHIVGAEALLRWTHPTRGLISPVEFIPVAEQSGLILPIGDWVMNTACHDALALRRDSGLYVSVNASTRQLAGGRFAEWVEEVLQRTDLAPSALTVEITEGALNHDIGPVRTAFEQLRSRGVRVAIDDFGTGFSSLARLQGIPVDVIKLDRAFVTDVDTRAEARGMAGAILQLGLAIGAAVIAEGVETEGEARTLLDLGYAFGQGFLFARPMPIAALSDRLAEA